MKKNHILFLVAALAIIASCKKDNTNNNNSSGIDGTYKFNGMHSTSNSTITSNDGEKIVTLADWTSANNQGTIVFNNGNATNTNFSYSVNSVSKGYYYEDNILVDSMSSPLVITIPTTNSVSTYQLIGSDSIYFPKGGFATIGTTTTSSNAGGGHYKMSVNQLTLTINGTKDSTFSDSGTMYQVQQSVVSSIVLVKQ